MIHQYEMYNEIFTNSVLIYIVKNIYTFHANTYSQYFHSDSQKKALCPSFVKRSKSNKSNKSIDEQSENSLYSRDADLGI